MGPSFLPLPRLHVLDAMFNFLAYIPLGVLVLCSLPSACRRFSLGSLASWLACTGLSASLELTQAFLPSRVSSKVDLVCNSLGAAVGVLLARGVLGLPRCVRAAGGSVVNGLLEGLDREATLTLGIWLFCLLSPLRSPFMMGPWLGDLAPLQLDSGVCDVVEGIGSLFGLTGSFMLALSQIQPNGRRLPIFIPFLLFAGLGGWLLPQIQTLANGLPLLSPRKLWGELGVASVAAAMVLGLCAARSDWPCRRMAQLSLVALCVTIACTAVVPDGRHLGIPPQAQPNQRFLMYLLSAADRLAAVWSVLGALAAWRLSRKVF